MEIYIIVFVMVTVGVMLDIFNHKIKDYYFFINFIAIYFLVALRYDIGVDYTPIYKELFYNAKTLFEINLDYFIADNNSNVEFGYLIFESVIKTFSDSFELFILFYSFTIFAFIFMGIRQNRYKNIQLLILLCFIIPIYIMDFHRQGLSMAIFLYNIKNIVHKKMLAYYFFAILSILFHYASIFLLPLYFIVNTFRLSRSFLLIVLLICTVFSYADTMGWIIDILYRIAPDNPLISRLYYYYFIKVDTTVSVGILAHAKRFVLLILGLIFFRKIDKNYTLLVVLEPLIFILFSNIGLLAGRIAGMFLVTYLWYFSHLFKNLHYNTNKLLLGIFIIIWSGSVFFKDLQTPHPEKHGEYNYIPYKSILSE